MSDGDGIDSLLEYIVVDVCGFYCYIPSYHTCKTDAFRCSKRAVLICCGKLPGMLDQGPDSLPRVDKRGEKDI
jgi:hypothetical protein